MTEYPNSGILNANRYKRAGSKQPDLNGKAVMTCVHCQQETEFEMAAWHRGKFTTVAFTEKAEAERKRAAAKAKRAGIPEENAESGNAEMPTPAEGSVPF